MCQCLSYYLLYLLTIIVSDIVSEGVMVETLNPAIRVQISVEPEVTCYKHSKIRPLLSWPLLFSNKLLVVSHQDIFTRFCLPFLFILIILCGNLKRKTCHMQPSLLILKYEHQTWQLFHLFQWALIWFQFTSDAFDRRLITARMLNIRGITSCRSPGSSSRALRSPCPRAEPRHLWGTGGSCWGRPWRCWCATPVCRPWCTWPGCSLTACTDGRRLIRWCQWSTWKSSHRYESYHRPAEGTEGDVQLLSHTKPCSFYPEEVSHLENSLPLPVVGNQEVSLAELVVFGQEVPAHDSVEEGGEKCVESFRCTIIVIIIITTTWCI